MSTELNQLRLLTKPNRGATMGDPVRALCTDLFARGVQLRLEDGRIRWTAKTGRMTIDLVRRIKAHEAELVATLSGPAWATTEQEGA
jgi:hypothetical protein